MRRLTWLAAIAAAGVQLGCGGSSGDSTTPTGLPPTTNTPAGPLTVTPALTAIGPGRTASFTATNAAAAPQAVMWGVNGVNGGSPQLGTVSPAGVYTAPTVTPAGDSVVVSAVLNANNTVQQSATVFFLADNTSRDYFVPIPRVVDATRPAPTRFLIVPPATVAAVSFVPLSGATIPATPIGGALTFTLDGATQTNGYIAGRLHNVVGRLDYRTASGSQVKLTSLVVNVRDAGMPDVAVVPLAADAQRSAYVLNLRVDTATIGPSASIVSRALQLLGGDRFDFVAVVATVTSNNNRYYVGVRNDIRGIGAPVYDNSSAYGGSGRLRGVIAFPIDSYFDGAEAGFIHETGHAWVNYATDAVLGAGAPHWPPSTLAQGVMGFSLGVTREGGQFPWTLTSLGNGTVRVARSTPSDLFTPFDLYVMGLLPPDSVPPAYVLPPATNLSALADGLVLPASTFTIADYVAAMGARIPAAVAAPRQFATACVVLTYGRLMTATEMAFFDNAVMRAETTTQLTSVSGFATVPADGFFLATGRRATLRTRLQ